MSQFSFLDAWSTTPELEYFQICVIRIITYLGIEGVLSHRKSNYFSYAFIKSAKRRSPFGMHFMQAYAMEKSLTHLTSHLTT